MSTWCILLGSPQTRSLMSWVVSEVHRDCVMSFTTASLKCFPCSIPHIQLQPDRSAEVVTERYVEEPNAAIPRTTKTSLLLAHTQQPLYWCIQKGKAEDSPVEEKHWSNTQNPNSSWEWVLLRVSENLDLELETLHLEVPSYLTEFYTHPSTLHPTCPSLHHLDLGSRMLGLGTPDLDALCASY